MIITYENPKNLDFDIYKIKEVLLNGEKISTGKSLGNTVTIKRDLIESTQVECALQIILGKK